MIRLYSYRGGGIHKRKKGGLHLYTLSEPTSVGLRVPGPMPVTQHLLPWPPQLNEGHRHEQRESPNCCLFANGAVDDHLPLLGLNVRGGYVGAPAASLNCTLLLHLHVEQLMWTEQSTDGHVTSDVRIAVAVRIE